MARPLFVNFLTGQPMPVINGLQPGDITTDLIADGAVTNDKLAPMDQALIKGRAVGAGTGPPQDLTATQVLAILGYEEGLWTPGISFGGASVGVTYTRQIGRYTKFGNVVNVWGRLTINNNGTSVGDAEITGLPFVASNIADLYYVGSIIIIGGTGAVGGTLLRADFNTNIAGIYQTLTGSADLLAETNIPNGTDMFIQLTYRTG